MKKLCYVVILLWMNNKLIQVESLESCCSYQDIANRANDYIDTITEEYHTAELNDKPNIPAKTTLNPEADEIVTQTQILTSKNKTVGQNLCNNDNRVTNVYERAHDIDMKYVQDSITSMWRIIFSLVLILILLAFLISYVYSLIKKHNVEKATIKRTENRRNFPDTLAEKNAQLYFPVINVSRTANFLRDLDPIYDYPCSVLSDYDKM